MKAFAACLYVCVVLFLAGFEGHATESLIAVGGGVGLLELGGLKALLNISSQAQLIWQVVVEMPAEQRVSARFTLGTGSFNSISLTQLDTLLLFNFRVGAKAYVGAGSGLMHFVSSDIDLWRFASYGLVGLKSDIFQNTTFFFDLKLIVFLPDVEVTLAKGAAHLQFSFGMIFKL